ncbi:MAG: hypothetical protein COB30_018865 [Ectothiorhodospiraceae bacterium]|nr:hypothetical protein [Ectothiorhodospiraceae bacterium]
MELQLTQGNLGALARMCFLAEREAGRRFKLSQPESVLELLKHVALSTDQELGRLFRDFFGTLDVGVREQLVYRGVQVPSELHEKAAVASAGAAAVAKQSQRVYRGRVIEGIEPPAAAPVPGAKKRPKRVYRGRVIED